MKIPIKIYDIINQALLLQNEENFIRYNDKRIRNAEDRKVDNAFKWLRKHKRKQKLIIK